jgi:DNA-binding beta-propeller fold protein YncE
MRAASRRHRWFLLFVLLLLSLYFPSYVHADGGAPNLAYVSGTAQGISVIDVAQQKVVRTISVAGDPHTILLSLDGGFLYVTQPTIGRFSVIAANTGKTICSASLPGQPTLLASDPITNSLYAAGNGAARVSALDPSTCAVQHTFNADSPVYGLAVAILSDLPGGGSNQLWVAGTNALTVFDDHTGHLLGSIPIEGGPQYLSIPPGDTVYVTTRQGSVDAVNIKTWQVHKLLTGGTFGTMDYDALSTEVYIPDEQHNLLDVLSPINAGTATLPKEPNRVIRLDFSPASIAITNDGLLGFVAERGGKVSMLDLLNRHIIYTFDVGGTPRFVITGLYPPPVDTTPPKRPSQQVSTQDNTREIVGYTLLAVSFIALLLLILLFLRFLQVYGTDDQRRPPGTSIK